MSPTDRDGSGPDDPVERLWDLIAALGDPDATHGTDGDGDSDADGDPDADGPFRVDYDVDVSVGLEGFDGLDRSPPRGSKRTRHPGFGGDGSSEDPDREGDARPAGDPGRSGTPGGPDHPGTSSGPDQPRAPGGPDHPGTSGDPRTTADSSYHVDVRADGDELELAADLPDLGAEPTVETVDGDVLVTADGDVVHRVPTDWPAATVTRATFNNGVLLAGIRRAPGAPGGSGSGGEGGTDPTDGASTDGGDTDA